MRTSSIVPVLALLLSAACHDGSTGPECGDCVGGGPPDLSMSDMPPIPTNPQPDLVVTSIDWAQDPATSYTVRFNATVKNQGTLATPAGTVLKVSFNVDGVVHSWSDTNTTALMPGDSVTLTANAAPGASQIYTPDGYAHTILATVDDGSLITESDESNNTLTAPLGGMPSVASGFDFNMYLQPSWGTGAIAADNGVDTVGAFRFICAPSHLGWDDPIAYPGQPGMSHLHQFFGNDMADANSTYQSLRSTGMSSCGQLVNRSAYWMPAMMTATGKVVLPDLVSVYYKRLPKTSPDCTKAGIACVPIPRGLRFIFGYNFKTGTKSDAYFNCQGPGSVAGHFDDIITAAQGCQLGDQLGAVLSAPNCWDGARLDSADHRSHVAFASYGDWGYSKCPDTHPFIIPTFTLGAWYTVDDDLDHSGTYTPGVTKTWFLASDMMGMTQTPGETLHSDWFGAWDDDVQKMWTDGCIDSHLNCSGGDLGNGLQIKGASQPYPSSWISTPHQVDPPPHP